ncbi:MAG: PDZ domain-containing protein [Candidatus Buchananbacteria bacterium]|nr:PDZ domain-containing protein [Candidatus Buchananbacteria bacterium]
MKLFKNQKDRKLLQSIFLASAFGFFAGLAGQALGTVYFDPWRQHFLNYQTQVIQQQNNQTSDIQELKKVKKVIGTEQDFAVDQAIRKVDASVVGFYPIKKASQNILQSIYYPADLLGSGFILTSDGWLATDQSVVNENKKGLVVVVYQGQEYKIDQLVTDPMTGITFVKITANNLPVVLLGDSDELLAGQLVVGDNSFGQASVDYVKSLNFQNQSTSQDYVLSSEKYARFILLTNNLDNSYLGGPIINSNGEVVGVIQSNKNQTIVVPINHFRPVLVSVFRDGSIRRSYLGVQYIDLSNTTSASDQQSGALIYSQPKKNSPAANAKLQVGDVIISVENQLIDKTNSLAEIIQQYQSGDSLNLEVLRDDKNIKLNVSLSPLP